MNLGKLLSAVWREGEKERKQVGKRYGNREERSKHCEL